MSTPEWNCTLSPAKIAHCGRGWGRVVGSREPPSSVNETEVGCQPSEQSRGRGELGVVPHPVAVAADVDDVTVMDEAVDQRGGHDLVAEVHAQPTEALRGTPAMADIVPGTTRPACKSRMLLFSGVSDG